QLPLGMDTCSPPSVPVALVHPGPAIVANDPADLPEPPAASPVPSCQPSPPRAKQREAGTPVTNMESEEVLVDSQSILFSDNPFVVANKKRPGANGATLGGPPVGYGNSGVLKTSVYVKKTPSGDSATGTKWDAPSSPSAQQASINFLSQNDSRGVSSWRPARRLSVCVSVCLCVCLSVCVCVCLC
ncbi:hypothetical protein FKM82_020760, partial [Ascaphus truei]